MSTNHRCTTDLAAAKPSQFGTTATDYVVAEKQYTALSVNTDWSVIEAGGARLARTIDGVTTVVTTVGDLEVAKRVCTLVGWLTGTLPTDLYRLGIHAAGTPVDMPRLARHIWDTGVDPWDDKPGATGSLAELAQLTRDLPTPVRASIAKVVFETWDWFGPVLVPAKLTWTDNWTHDEDTITIDLSAVLGSAADSTVVDLARDGEGDHDLAASLSYLDHGAGRVLRECDLDEGVTVSAGPKGRAATRAWVAVHRPHLLAQLDQ